jgi:rhamnulose-1-phosphate aldolase
MRVLDAECTKKFMQMAEDGWEQGWHERNGGNLSYRMTMDDVASVAENFDLTAKWRPIGTSVPGLAREHFFITGTGRYFQNVVRDPEHSFGIIEVDETGENYRIVWGLLDGGRPTSELPTHLMNHEVKKAQTNGAHRVIYHCHPANVIALTFVLPLTDEAFTRELWEMMTECPVIFPDGIGVVPWMVPGGRAIAVESAKKMQSYNAVIWAMHGIFCSGATFDETFGLVHTIDKSAGILLKVLAAGGKRQTITTQDFRDLAKDFHLTLPEKFLDVKEEKSETAKTAKTAKAAKVTK